MVHFYIKLQVLKKHHSSGAGLLSQGLCPSTIGAERLDFRVRDGNGYGPLARSTRTMMPFYEIRITNSLQIYKYYLPYPMNLPKFADSYCVYS